MPLPPLVLLILAAVVVVPTLLFSFLGGGLHREQEPEPVIMIPINTPSVCVEAFIVFDVDECEIDLNWRREI